MSDLGDLLALALVGTARGALPSSALPSPAQPSPGPQALAQASAGLTRPDPEGTLLARAALLTLAHRAGRLPDQAADLPPPAPAETRPEAPPSAAQYLPLVMGTPQLPEWLGLCARAGWRVPAAQLPALLDLARHDTGLRERLRPVLGERGTWLAGFSPEWRFVPATLDDGAWTDATEAGREALFRSLRGRDPHSGRDLLAARLPSERASSRKRLLGALLETLTPDDADLEPLLDSLLDDRSEDVRTLARRALQRLPSSAYNARMAGRLAALVQVGRPGVLGRLTGQTPFTLTLPSGPDPDGRRDGLDPGLGASGLLGQLLGATHPQALLTALNLPPAHAVALARQHEAGEELAASTIATGHRALAAALLPLFPNDPGLLLLGPPEGLRVAVGQALRAADAERLWPLLEALPAPWPADLTPPLWEALRRSLRGVPYLSAWPYRWREIYSLTMERADPHTVLTASSPDDLTPFAQQLLSELRGTFDLRVAMQREFKETHP
ncbi:DUF5691 domain-containing protein [Deinococcus koreensis]|uniref:Uncharacterized protein n=1 Tax=Deinococcus koreensis TaxID=2054903 RepID=A0A2K3V010_9DEIO|nr:DUF5691 domain-containing protein [Deinococcus koreensis]PNY82113.1 hypothetical protein CVO96_12695 [Deinococcus koreensis]